jgi:hypothetical protein
MNIKSKKFPNERCPYPSKRGNYCSRHYKNPITYEIPIVTRSVSTMIKKIQRFWRLKIGLRLAKERTPAFFVRSLCHNETELATFETLDSIPRDYFFAIKDSSRIWGFDIRTLVVQYEDSGKLENPYTKELFPSKVVETFRSRVDLLRSWKKPIHYEQESGLSQKQSWNLRVLDMCLRLDMLGYRISTHWFNDLDIIQQKNLYERIYCFWNDSVSPEMRETIVPGSSSGDKTLFKWTPGKIHSKTELDSVRRTNLNVMERMISSASQQSDRTLGAMYLVTALTRISYRCRQAYPWLLD